MLPDGELYKNQSCRGAEVTKPVSIEFGDLVEALFLERPNRFSLSAGSRRQVKKSWHIWLTQAASKNCSSPVPSFSYVSHHPRRKTKWSVVLVQTPDETTYVSLHAAMANQLTSEALQAG